MPKRSLPKQRQRQPGLESKMYPAPESVRPGYAGAGKLRDRVAIVTGGDSGIGRAVAMTFALEGADVVICHLPKEEADAKETARMVELVGRKALRFSSDVGMSKNCEKIVRETLKKLGRLDIVVNNAAEQHVQQSLTDITDEQLERTFRTNIFAHFFMSRAALPHLKAGASIINTTSVTA